mgnify:CR=1 FL=1
MFLKFFNIKIIFAIKCWKSNWEKKFFVLQRDDYNKYGRETLFEQVKKEIGIPFVAKAPHQGSSIGLAFVKEDAIEDFDKAIKKCLFIEEIYREGLCETSVFDPKIDGGAVRWKALHDRVIEHVRSYWQSSDTG